MYELISLPVFTEEEIKEHRKLWIEALRSEKYEQTKYYLKNDEGFCCLGVACDISNISEWIIDGDGLPSYMGLTNYLSIEMKNWLGISEYDVSILAIMNDKENQSFNEIASFIEKNIKISYTF
jgi:hypothetical protein